MFYRDFFTTDCIWRRSTQDLYNGSSFRFPTYVQWRDGVIMVPGYHSLTPSMACPALGSIIQVKVGATITAQCYVSIDVAQKACLDALKAGVRLEDTQINRARPANVTFNSTARAGERNSHT